MPLVKLYGNLRKIPLGASHKPVPTASAKSTPSIDIPADTIQELLDALCAGSSELCHALLEHGVLRPHIRVMVNGRDIELSQGLATPLTPQDQVSIFPPIAGG